MEKIARFPGDEKTSNFVTSVAVMIFSAPEEVGHFNPVWTPEGFGKGDR